MKVRIKSFNGELPSYLTVGKVYEVIAQYGYGSADIRVDNGMRTTITIGICRHLKGGLWEVVE